MGRARVRFRGQDGTRRWAQGRGGEGRVQRGEGSPQGAGPGGCAKASPEASPTDKAQRGAPRRLAQLGGVPSWDQSLPESPPPTKIRHFARFLLCLVWRALGIPPPPNLSGRLLLSICAKATRLSTRSGGHRSGVFSRVGRGATGQGDRTPTQGLPHRNQGYHSLLPLHAKVCWPVKNFLHEYQCSGLLAA